MCRLLEIAANRFPEYLSGQVSMNTFSERILIHHINNYDSLTSRYCSLICHLEFVDFDHSIVWLFPTYNLSYATKITFIMYTAS